MFVKTSIKSFFLKSKKEKEIIFKKYCSFMVTYDILSSIYTK